MEYHDYLPECLRNIADFKALGSAVQPELTLLRELIHHSAAEFFARTAAEEGLSRFEKLFHISPDPHMSAEQRRLRILGRLQNCPPFSVSWLSGRLDTVCGKDQFEITHCPEHTTLNVKIADTARSMAAGLFPEIRQSIPAAVSLETGLIHRNQLELSMGVILQIGTKFTWKEQEHGTV